MKQFNRKRGKGRKKCCITNLNNLKIVICPLSTLKRRYTILASHQFNKIFMPFSNAKINVCAPKKKIH